MIYPDAPAAHREVLPGEYVITGISAKWEQIRMAGYLNFTVRSAQMDIVCTMGMDFESLPDWYQEVVRSVMRPGAAIIRLDKP
jgi:hypothetical protein